MNLKVEDLPIQHDDSSSYGNTFRSPFDPRSEDLLPSSRENELRDYGNRPGKGKHGHRHSEWSLLGEVEAITESSKFDRLQSSDGLNAYDEEEENFGPKPIPCRRKDAGDARSASGDKEMYIRQESEEENDDLEDSWAEEESRLRPPALPINLESALAELPVEDPATRTKRLRPLQFPLYVNVGGDQNGASYNRNKVYSDTRPLRTMDQNIPEEELPDTVLIRTRCRTMSGVTGFLPRSSVLSSSSIWFGDHPVPSKTQIYVADNSPLRLSTIQLQAQAEIARRRSRSNLAVRSMVSGTGGLGRSQSFVGSRVTLAASTGSLYDPTGRRIHGGAPLVERAIKRHESHRDGYETLSLVHVPKLSGEETSSVIVAAANTAEQRRLKRPASSASIYKPRYGHAPSQIDATRNRDEARSLIAQAAVDLAVHTYDPSEV
nr:Copper amine oxidase [Hymenolepis microstoma]